SDPFRGRRYRPRVVEQIVLRPHARRVRRHRSGNQRSRPSASACAADAAPRYRCRRLHARLHPAYAAADGDDERAVEYLRFRRLERLATFSGIIVERSEEHTSELQSPCNLVCRLLLEKKKTTHTPHHVPLIDRAARLTRAPYRR